MMMISVKSDCCYQLFYYNKVYYNACHIRIRIRFITIVFTDKEFESNRK